MCLGWEESTWGCKITPAVLHNALRHMQRQLKRLAGVPWTTHCRLLPGLVCDRDPREQLESRLMKFLSACQASTNPIIKRCLAEILAGSGSAVSDTLTELCVRRHLARDCLPSRLKPQNDEHEAEARLLRVFVLLKEATSDRDITAIIDHLATS